MAGVVMMFLQNILILSHSYVCEMMMHEKYYILQGLKLRRSDSTVEYHTLRIRGNNKYIVPV